MQFQTSDTNSIRTGHYQVLAGGAFIHPEHGELPCQEAYWLLAERGIIQDGAHSMRRFCQQPATKFLADLRRRWGVVRVREIWR